jgi:hypothetical protein
MICVMLNPTMKPYPLPLKTAIELINDSPAIQ